MKRARAAVAKSPVTCDIIADAYAAHAVNTLARVVCDIWIGIKLLLFFGNAFGRCLVIGFFDIKAVAHIGKLTRSVCGTAHAVAVMVREYELEHFPAVFKKCIGIGRYHHAVLCLGTACGKKTVVTFHFNHAQSAASDITDTLKITQGRDIDTVCLCYIKYCCRLFGRVYFTVYSNVYHSPLPPSMAPHP